MRTLYTRGMREAMLAKLGMRKAAAETRAYDDALRASGINFVWQHHPN